MDASSRPTPVESDPKGREAPLHSGDLPPLESMRRPILSLGDISSSIACMIEGTPAITITLSIQRPGTQTPVPDLSIEVDNLTRSVSVAGSSIEYGPTSASRGGEALLCSRLFWASAQHPCSRIIVGPERRDLGRSIHHSLSRASHMDQNLKNLIRERAYFQSHEELIWPEKIVCGHPDHVAEN
jgi:hypothetical protein